MKISEAHARLCDAARKVTVLGDPDVDVGNVYESMMDAAVDIVDGKDAEAKAAAYVRLCGAAVALREVADLAADFVLAASRDVGEALVTAGRGGGVSVLGVHVMAGARFDVRLKIDDLCPPEALAPGAVGFDLTVAQAEASAEQRLVMRLDGLGAGQVAPRVLDHEALGDWIGNHQGGPATAIGLLAGAVEVDGVTVAEVVA